MQFLHLIDRIGIPHPPYQNSKFKEDFIMKNITVSGRITKDAELKTVKVGGVDTQVCNFNVAVNGRVLKDAQGQERKDANGYPLRETEFYSIALWRNYAAKMAQYLKKGRAVTVVGDNFSMSTWMDSQQVVHPKMTITNPKIEFNDGRRAEAPAEEPVAEAEPVDALDELPFAV